MILVTGFEAFGGQAINPSQEMIKALGARNDLRATIDARVLSVSYKRSVDQLRKLYDPREHSALLMFGQAGGRAKISLESRATNLIESSAADADNMSPLKAPIREGLPLYRDIRLPLARWAAEMNDIGIPTEVSSSAGGYVCNSLLYHALDIVKNPSRVLFVHVPYLPGQTEKDPVMAFEQMLKAAEFLIRKLSVRN